MKKKYIQPLLSISSLSASIILAASGGNSSPASGSMSNPALSSTTLNESQMRDLGFNNLAKSINNFIFDEDE